MIVKRLSKFCHFFVTTVERARLTSPTFSRYETRSLPLSIFRNHAAQPWGFCRPIPATAIGLLAAAILFLAVICPAERKPTNETYGGGLSVSVPVSEQELTQAVQDVVADGIIEGTKEYNKDEYVSGADAADATPAFDKWSGKGRVFFKVRKNALDPRNFKDSGDSGTLAVRYVVDRIDDKNTQLKIDAVFVDDFYHRPHASNGSVEGAEYKEIQGHLARMQMSRKEAAESETEYQRELAAKEIQQKQAAKKLEAEVSQAPDETLQHHVDKLRHDLERIVRGSGAQLKSAPFHSALSLKTLPAGSEVIIVISTQYWYGVETPEGLHGWIHQSELELLP